MITPKTQFLNDVLPNEMNPYTVNFEGSITTVDRPFHYVSLSFHYREQNGSQYNA